MSKHDLRARPVFHHTRDAIEAHLTVVMASLAVARYLQDATGISVKRVIRTLKPLQDVTINLNGHHLTAADPLTPKPKTSSPPSTSQQGTKNCATQVARSTVGRILARYDMPRLTEVDQATGLAVRRPPPVRYEKTSPGELVHLDIKKLGRIPDGGGWRAHGRGSAPAPGRGPRQDPHPPSGQPGRRLSVHPPRDRRLLACGLLRDPR